MRPTQKAVDFFKQSGWKDDQLEAQGYTKDGEPTDAILTALETAGWSEDAMIQNGVAEATSTAKPDEKVARFISLRDEIDSLKKELKEKEKPLKEEMETIQLDLSTLLDTTGQSKMGSDYGTFFFAEKNTVTVSDFEAYQKWFINTILNRLTAKGFLVQDKTQYEACEAAMDAMGLNFMTQAVRKEAVIEHQKEHGTPPPGISTESFREVQVRRATKK